MATLDALTDPRFFGPLGPRTFMVAVSYGAAPDRQVPVQILRGWMTRDGTEWWVPEPLTAAHARLLPSAVRVSDLREMEPWSKS